MWVGRSTATINCLFYALPPLEVSFIVMASPRSLPCDPLRREIGHCAFLAPARLACTSTPAVFNFGDFWLELAARMVSTGLNQGGGGVSDPVRSLIRLEQSWEIGTIVDMCGYYTQTQARLHSRLIPANYPHVTPCYWGGGVLGGGRGHPSQHSTAWCNIAEGDCDPSTALLFLIVLAFSRGGSVFSA